ncbi:hypothetical protein Tco_1421199 [Tanacetum coccineum]
MVKEGIVLGHKISRAGIEVPFLRQKERKVFQSILLCKQNNWTEGSENYTSTEKQGVERNNQLNELEELRLQAYETSKTYKERTKKWHDNRLKEKVIFDEKKLGNY